MTHGCLLLLVGEGERTGALLGTPLSSMSDSLIDYFIDRRAFTRAFIQDRAMSSGITLNCSEERYYLDSLVKYVRSGALWFVWCAEFQ